MPPLEKHPNADSLSIARIFGYPVVVRTADWVDCRKAVYIPPDNIVDTSRPEFSFLASHGKIGPVRVTIRNMRGIQSYGLLIPAPDGAVLGDDLSQQLGVEHYVPPEPMKQGTSMRAPRLHVPVYDIESLRRYSRIFRQGEQVVVTEKLDGSNTRFVFADGEMYVGSHKAWKSRDSMFGIMLDKYPGIEVFCRRFPRCVLYGELYGRTNAIKYFKNENRFAVFDVYDVVANCFLNWDDLCDVAIQFQLPVVPTLGTFSYDFDYFCDLAEGNTHATDAVTDCIREGIVVRPTSERWTDEIGRLILKLHSQQYLKKTKKLESASRGLAERTE